MTDAELSDEQVTDAIKDFLRNHPDQEYAGYEGFVKALNLQNATARSVKRGLNKLIHGTREAYRLREENPRDSYQERLIILGLFPEHTVQSSPATLSD